MRIRSSIFFWVFLATIVPLTVLALSATYYTEFSYQRDVTRTVNTSLNSLAAEIKRDMQSNRELALGMSRAPAVENFLPVLKAVRDNESLADANIRRSRINHFFEGFQTIIRGAFYLRVLDVNGNTLVKVSQTQRSQAVYETLSGINYVEQEVNIPDFGDKLKSLPRDDVTALFLPQREEYNQVNSLPLQDYVVPLYYEDQHVGALTVTLFGEHIDQIMDHAPKLYDGKFYITESNPEDDKRHGLLLYDSEHELRLDQVRTSQHMIQDYYGARLLEEAINQTEGRFFSDNKKYINYFMEVFPYPENLTNWIITFRVKADTISAPFIQVRGWIWLIATSGLVISLLLTNIGASVIAKPVTMLANNLKAYADGEHNQRADTKQTINEIASLANAFNYLADTLDQAQLERDRAQHMMLQTSKLASIGEMAAGIGHEINNPLNNILSYTKLISRSIASNSDRLEPKDITRLQHDLDSLRDEALRASNIVRGILNFARQVPPDYTSFAIQPWLEDTLKLVQQTARSRHIHLHLSYSEEGELQGDRGQLQQALINLLLNAIQASPENEDVWIDAWTDEDRLIIRIVDHGSGIRAGDMDRIYDPFFTTKPEGEGSGLGLSISLGIIEYHHGTITIENNDGQGTTASIILPLTPELYA